MTREGAINSDGRSEIEGRERRGRGGMEGEKGGRD